MGMTHKNSPRAKIKRKLPWNFILPRKGASRSSGNSVTTAKSAEPIRFFVFPYINKVRATLLMPEPKEEMKSASKRRIKLCVDCVVCVRAIIAFLLFLSNVIKVLHSFFSLSYYLNQLCFS